MHTNFDRTRQLFIFLLIISILTILFFRLFYLQILSHKHFENLADAQHKKMIPLEPVRGILYDRNKNILALNVEVDSIFAVPRVIEKKQYIAEKLSAVLGLNKAELLEKLKQDRAFIWVKRKLDKEKIDLVQKLNLEGIGFLKETRRFYPGTKLACHLIGFVDIDNKGLEGVELYHDNFLRGNPGWRIAMLDAKQRDVVHFGKEGVAPMDGYDIVLTIDEVIQNIVETEIERIINTSKAKACSIIVIEPKTGAILAMSNYPWFDLNSFQNATLDEIRNRSIADCFEPGSVFKIVTASAALEEGIVDFDKKFYCENGSYKIKGRAKPLHDYRPYGELTFREVVEKSSNIGVVKVAQMLGERRLFDYIKCFEFGSPKGIDLPGEAGGIIRNLPQWSSVDITTIPIGQGISVTAMQLVSAISAIANDGVMMKPYIVTRVTDSRGNVIKQFQPSALKRIISKRTASSMKEILYGVVEKGTGRGARLAGYTACGKTGTAEKVNPAGGYWHDKHIASFIGFAPMENPSIAMVISVDEPKGLHFGGQVAAPAFKNISEKVLRYLEIYPLSVSAPKGANTEG